MSCTLFMVYCTRFGGFVCRHNNIRYTLCYVYQIIIQKEPAHWMFGLNNAWALTRWIIWLNKGRTAHCLKLRTYFHRMIMVSCIVYAAVCWCLRSFEVWRDFVNFPLNESSCDDRLHCIGIQSVFIKDRFVVSALFFFWVNDVNLIVIARSNCQGLFNRLEWYFELKSRERKNRQICVRNVETWEVQNALNCEWMMVMNKLFD